MNCNVYTCNVCTCTAWIHWNLHIYFKILDSIVWYVTKFIWKFVINKESYSLYVQLLLQYTFLCSLLSKDNFCPPLNLILSFVDEEEEEDAASARMRDAARKVFQQLNESREESPNQSVGKNTTPVWDHNEWEMSNCVHCLFNLLPLSAKIMLRDFSQPDISFC